MGRKSKPYEEMTAAERKAKAARLAARRARYAKNKALKELSDAQELEPDYDSLLNKSEMEKRGAIPPKTVRTARENLTAAFDLMGGVPGLVKWGKKNPTEFYRMWARLIPKESVEASVALPLESLLDKLSTKEHMSVQDAAMEIGAEILEAAREQVAVEDAAHGPRPEDTIN